MTAVLLALRFVLELCLLAAFAVIGWDAFDNVVARLVAALALPLAVALVWGMALSPRRRIDLPLVVRVLAELALFLTAAVGVWSAGFPVAAIVLAAAEVVVLGGLALRGVRPGADPGAGRG
ncbi:MAG: DUF2568 domain-containing protein [Actinomycetales bacterium]|nr:DUF2568 domain-containing protein [Actinomycetales bacterium]